jgi:uncharacterized membrane protein
LDQAAGSPGAPDGAPHAAPPAAWPGAGSEPTRTEVEEMGRRSPNVGIGGRTQQAGTLVAATVMPLTFQPTLMPRSPLDQALVTGISTALNYSFAALVQDSIEAMALRGAGRTDPARVDRHTWRRASIGLDLAAIAPGWPSRAPRGHGRASGCRAGACAPPAGGCRPPACPAPPSACSRS